MGIKNNPLVRKIQQEKGNQMIVGSINYLNATSFIKKRVKTKLDIEKEWSKTQELMLQKQLDYYMAKDNDMNDDAKNSKKWSFCNWSL